MNPSKVLLLGCFTSLLITTLSSCSPSPPSVSESPLPAVPSPTSPPPSPTPIPVPTPSAAKQSPPRSTLNATAQKTILVNIYKPDNQCLELVPEKVAVAADQPIRGAIAEVIEDRDSADFSVANYQVKVNNNVATVDLQVAPGSKRSFQSLSACEQMALFGSIQKTLTSHSGWNVQSVQFTQNGKELVF